MDHQRAAVARPPITRGRLGPAGLPSGSRDRLRYWEAARNRAAASGDDRAEWVADALAQSHAATLIEPATPVS